MIHDQEANDVAVPKKVRVCGILQNMLTTAPKCVAMH
jgi:hypothetical protein